MVSADSYGIDHTGATDVLSALSAAINAQSPGTTFTLHAGGLYLTTYNLPLIITAPGVIIDGLGASLFRNQRRTATTGTTPHDNILTISAANVTVRNLKIYGFRKDIYTGDVLTTVAGSPSVVSTTTQLDTQNEEVRLPKVGLDIDSTINLPANPVSTHPHPFTNYETPYYFRQVDGTLKFEASLSGTGGANDAVFSVIDDTNGAVVYSQTFSPTAQATYTLSFTPTTTQLGIPMRITVRKANVGGVLTVHSITPYGECGYRDRDMSGTYGYFTGGQEFSDGISVTAVSGTLLEDIDIEGPDGDGVNCVDQDTNTVIRRVHVRGCGRQGFTQHRAISPLLEDSSAREVGRSGIDLEPNAVTDQMTNGIMRRMTFTNVRNWTFGGRHWAKNNLYTLEDVTSTNAGMGGWYGGGKGMIVNNFVHQGTYRTLADRIRNQPETDPALNGGVEADAIIFGTDMVVTGFTTSIGIQLAVVTNNYNPGSGIITYSPDNIQVGGAVVTNPTTNPFVYIGATNSSVTVTGSGGVYFGQVWDSSNAAWDSALVFWDGAKDQPGFYFFGFQFDAFQVQSMVAGDVAQTMSAFTQAAVGLSAKIAAISQEMAAFTQTGVAAVIHEVQISQSLGAFTQEVAGSLIVRGHIGTLVGAFQDDFVNADGFQTGADIPDAMPAFRQHLHGGVATSPAVFAIIRQTMPAFTQTLESNGLVISGGIVQRMGAFRQVATGENSPAGAISQELSAFHQAALGIITVNAFAVIHQRMPAFTQHMRVEETRWDEWDVDEDGEWPVTRSDEWLVRQE